MLFSKEFDREGREIIYGPVFADLPSYSNIHIVSNSYGIIANRPLRLSNVVIEANVCVQHPGMELEIRDSYLLCRLGIEFTRNVFIGNSLINNAYSGKLSNRPDIF